MENDMKKKLLLATGGLLMAVGICLLKANIQMDITADVLAGTTPNMLQKAACTDPTNAAFTPDPSFDISWTITANAAPLASVTESLTTPVNNDITVAVASNMNVGAIPSGFLGLTVRAPKHKLDGLHCQTLSQSTLKMNGDGADNVRFDVAVSNLADDDAGYTVADKVDAVASGTPVMIFGTGGQIAGSAITDANDAPAKEDGQVVFGGTVEAQGGYELHVVVDVTNYDVQNTTDQETITETFTAS